MLRKPPEEPVNQQQQSGNRIKLPEETAIRSISGFKEILAMAEAYKGSQIELSWTTKTPSQRFVLDMQWDANQKAPFWTLYEENDGKSKRLWDEPFPLANVDMCYDILVMTCGAVEQSTKGLAEILKSQPEKMDWSKPSIKSSPDQAIEPSPAAEPSKVISPSEQVPASVGQGNDRSGVSSGVSSAPPNTSSEPAGQNVIPADSFPVTANQNPAFPPGYMFPPAVGMPGNPGIGFPMPVYIPSNLPVQPNAPPTYPANVNPANAGFFPPQIGPPQIWQYGGAANAYDQPDMTNPALQNAPMQNAAMQNMPPQNMPVTSFPPEGSLARLPVDAALFNKQNDISLVDLLVKAELITEISLAAALKIQELIQAGTIDWQKAAEVLKNQHNKGQNIHDYIDLATTPGEKSSGSGSAVFDLLSQAGLISKEDIKLARDVIKKHGGDMMAILQSAQKLDEKTFEAAKICCELQNDGLLKVEQSVIVLNYCSRSRVNFDEALTELNWPNPRKSSISS